MEGGSEGPGPRATSVASMTTSVASIMASIASRPEHLASMPSPGFSPSPSRPVCLPDGQAVNPQCLSPDRTGLEEKKEGEEEEEKARLETNDLSTDVDRR